MPHVFVGTQPRKKVSAAAAPPLLAYHGGPLLANVKLITIFWGSAWLADSLRNSIQEFADFVVTSSLIDQLHEYSVLPSVDQPGQSIGHGTHPQTFLDTSDPPPTLADADIQSYLQQKIAQGTLESPDADTVYAVFLPAGVTVVLQGQASCQQFCGYHSVTPDGSIVYIVDTYDDCPGCQFAAGDTLGSSTAILSHELCEAITDPHLDGWFDDNTGFEIGDICEPQTKVITVAVPLAGPTYNISGTGTSDEAGNITASLTLTPQAPTPPVHSWVVQKEWSNAQGACV